MRPSIWAFVRLEPSAWKQACSVLRELGGGDAARLPGAANQHFLFPAEIILTQCDV